MVHQGWSTCTKLSGEGMKLLKQLGEHSEEYKPLKKAYTECQKHISDLKHIQDFKELPDDKKLTQDSFDKYMAQVLSQQIICFSLIWHDDDALIFWFFKWLIPFCWTVPFQHVMSPNGRLLPVHSPSTNWWRGPKDNSKLSPTRRGMSLQEEGRWWPSFDSSRAFCPAACTPVKASIIFGLPLDRTMQ